jgi:hypothetical protein
MNCHENLAAMTAKAAGKMVWSHQSGMSPNAMVLLEISL